MGTTTFYLRHNDFGRYLDRMTKKELEKLSKISPYDKEPYYLGWKVPLELHNGNVYVLVFWKGKLMRLEDAPDELKNKHWDKYRGKALNVYEWTLLRRLILNQIEYLDKKFRGILKKETKKKKDPTKACIICGSKNIKLACEGLENDRYKCLDCGKEYGVSDLRRIAGFTKQEIEKIDKKNESKT